MSPKVALQIRPELKRGREECQADGKHLPASLKTLPTVRENTHCRYGASEYLAILLGWVSILYTATLQ